MSLMQHKIKIDNLINKFQSLAPLLARLVLGYVFMQSGYGKFMNLANTIEFFTSLGIPLPALQAPFVAFVELVGGLCIVLGLLTPYAAMPLIGTMIVALLTAQRENIESLSDLFASSEFLYILLFCYLVFYGAGAISLDRKLAK